MTEKVAVPGEFDRVARSYDLLSALNPGYTKHLRWSAERMELPEGARILDLCCGTGLSTEALKRAYPSAVITGLDASAGMLESARDKADLADVTWLLGNAMDPAAAGAHGPYDGVLMAYGIRNVPDPDLCLERVRRLLVSGGTLCLHEYSVAGSLWSKLVWNLVTMGIVIPLGLLFARTTTIFRYLRRSVLDFDSVGELEERMRKAGFTEVRSKTMVGWQRGIVHSFLAKS
ncbi:MAG: class I SAM-dependent methyltransferase [Gemmatimonadota bacterium]|nr:class I SAM-dependent methyltransferase [Gemmatimonadota bacterium]